MLRPYLCIVTAAALLLCASTCHGAVIFNVGLPRTGTTSFHYAVASMNLSSQHVAFNRSRYDLEQDNLKANLQKFRSSGQGPFRWLFDAFDAFSDTPVYGLIPAIKKFYPDAAIVATHRSRESWLKSMSKNPGAGASYLWKDSQLHTPGKKECVTKYDQRHHKNVTKCTKNAPKSTKRAHLYDKHAELMDQNGVIRIGSWSMLFCPR